MKLAMVVAATLLLGYLLGGWPQRSAVYRLQTQVAELEVQLEEKAFDGNPSLSGIARMLNVPASPAPEPPPPPEEDTAGEAGDGDETAETDPESTSAEPTPEPAPEAPREPPSPEEIRRQIENAAELWEMRSDLARSGFLNNIGADDEQALRFDIVMEAMNLRLSGSIENWSEVLAQGDMPVREAGIRMMNEISEAMVITYDELDRKLPAGWKGDAGPEFQLIDFVDPAVALPLAEVGDRLDF